MKEGRKPEYPEKTPGYELQKTSLRVPYQNGISRLYNMIEIYQSNP